MTKEQERKRAWLRRGLKIERRAEALEALWCRDLRLADYGEELLGMSGRELLRCLQMQMEEDLWALCWCREEILARIRCIGDDDLEAILINRFLCGRTCQETADAMHYDVRTIQRKLLDALDALEIPEAYKKPAP